MKKLSKLMAVVLAVAMVLALAACGSTGGAASAPAASGSGAASGSRSAAPAGDGQTYKIGICQLVQHEALDAANQGFQDALTEKLGDAVKFDDQNASGDSANCSTIVNGFVSDGDDLILAIATSPLQAAASAFAVQTAPRPMARIAQTTAHATASTPRENPFQAFTARLRRSAPVLLPRFGSFRGSIPIFPMETFFLSFRE